MLSPTVSLPYLLGLSIFVSPLESTTFELGSDVKVAIAYRQGPRDTELPTSQQVVQDDAAACMPSRLPTGL